MVGLGWSLGFPSRCSSQGPDLMCQWVNESTTDLLPQLLHVWLPWEWFCKGGGAKAAGERDLRRGWLCARGWPASRLVPFHEVIDSVTRFILVSGRGTQILILLSYFGLLSNATCCLILYLPFWMARAQAQGEVSFATCFFRQKSQAENMASLCWSCTLCLLVFFQNKFCWQL